MNSVLGWLVGRVGPRSVAIAELRAMSAAQLADLGITRAQIEAYVDGRLPRPSRPVRPMLRVIDGGWRAA